MIAGIALLGWHHAVTHGATLEPHRLPDRDPFAIVQLAVLWIATAWLGTGLYIAPAISRREPRLQRLGVNALWVALLVIVVGAFAGQWLAVQQRLGLDWNFWFGHQG